MKKTLLTLIALFLLLTVHSATDSTVIDFVQKFKKAQLYSGSEKLFLHTDKPMYIAGEDIWFQTYLVSPYSHSPITYEKLLYVELISPKGITLEKRMYKLENGKCSGSLKLKYNLTDGKYLIMAYTNWMRNQGSDFFYKKEINIIAQKENLSQLGHNSSYPLNTKLNEEHSDSAENKQVNLAKLHLQFMPEGGDMIDGILSRIAFIGVNQSGKPMEFNGKVVDEQGQSHVMFQAIHEGKGYFMLQPEIGKQYTAIVTGNNGEELEFPLPEVKSSGYSLRVENPLYKDSLSIHINSSQIPSQSAFRFIAQQDGHLKKILQGNLVNGRQQFMVSKTLFKTGIVHFTIFDTQMTPYCERLVFINHHDALAIKIEDLPVDLKERKKVAFEIEVKDKDGKPVQGEFSMAVTDAGKVSDDTYTSHNLVNYTYLSSNLRGRIDNPAFYFQESPQGHMASDLLMMVNGWRRFAWKEILTDSLPKLEYVLEQGIYVNGKLKRRKSQKPAPAGIVLTMWTKEEILDGYTETTDENGEFQFELRPFNDTLSVAVHTKNRLNRDAQFTTELTSNLKFEAADYYARRLMLANENVPSTFYHAEALSSTEINREKGGLFEKTKQENPKTYFDDTTAIVLETVEVIEDRIRSPREAMAQKYGAPKAVVGQRNIEQLVDETPWQFGLGTMIYDAIPGLTIHYDGEQTDFTMTNQVQHNIFIFVDGKLFGIVSDDWTDTACVFTHSRNKIQAVAVGYSINDFQSLDPLVVESIEFITNPKQSPFQEALMSLDLQACQIATLNRNPSAILSIYTKSGEGIFSQSPQWGISNYKIYGFEKAREFYAPQYDGTDDEIYDRDERTILYWEPTIVTDSLGKANVSFYNSDVAKKLRVDIAGFSNTGIPGAKIFTKGNMMDSLKNIENLAEAPKNLEQEGDTQTTTITTIGHISNTNKLAFIGVKGKTWSTVSNSEGRFDIDSTQVYHTDTLVVEVPAYGFAEITVKDLIEKGGELELSVLKSTSSTAEVKGIVSHMLRRKNKNISLNTYYLKGVYRESIFKDDKLCRLSDFSFYQRKEGYRSSMNSHYTMPIGGRIFKMENYSNFVKDEPINTMNDLVPEMDPLNKGLSFLNKAYRREYDYQLIGELDFQGRTMYQINFDQKDDLARAFLQGYMLIDKETYGLAYINWQQSDKGEKYEIPQQFLMPRKETKDFERLYENNEAFYTFEEKGLWKLKRVTQQVTLTINNTQFSYNRDVEVCENLDKKPEKFKSQTLDGMNKQSLLIKHANYTPTDWREIWCLPTEQYINTQIRHLHELTIYD